MIPYDRLSQIVPADQALACKALSVSLPQIAGISTMLMPSLAQVVYAQETTFDLPLISALTTAVPPAVAEYFANTAVGTGSGNSIVVCDILGTAAGYVSAGALANTMSNLANINVANLTVTYSTMANVVDGVYGDPSLGPVVIPVGNPYANTYTDAEDAFTNALIPGAQGQISTAIASYPSATANLNVNWDNMAGQLTLEKNLQAQAGIDFANLQHSTNTMYSFIFNIPSYGRDTQTGGVCQLVESTADYTTFTGQAVIASLREGRNQIALQSVGIATNSQIPADPNPPPPMANLIPSTYTAQQAANIVVV